MHTIFNPNENDKTKHLNVTPATISIIIEGNSLNIKRGGSHQKPLKYRGVLGYTLFVCRMHVSTMLVDRVPSCRLFPMPNVNAVCTNVSHMPESLPHKIIVTCMCYQGLRFKQCGDTIPIPFPLPALNTNTPSCRGYMMIKLR